MLKQLQNRITIGKDWLSTYQKQITLLKNVIIKNKMLSQELERACDEKYGILTYEEYLTLDQFGKYGFYATSRFHGQTDIHKRWGSALARYCLEHEHDTIIEFGCGTGELGIATVKAYKKLINKKLNWVGVEIDKKIHKIIFENFKDCGIESSVGAVVSSLEEIPKTKNVLIVFPYCLDNVPPQVFLNIKPISSYPDSLLGITVKNSMLSEVIIPQEILHKKRLKLEHGFFTQNDVIYKLSGWKLRRGQRLYLSPKAFGAIYNYAIYFENASIIIIDELRDEPWSYSLGNYGTPKSLYEKNLQCNERVRYYRESGKYNLYYPMYKESLYKFLSFIGFQSIDYEIEDKMAKYLSNKRWFSLRKKYARYAFFAKNFIEKKIKVLPIPSPQKKIF